MAYGVSQSELQLPVCATATATRDPSHVCDLHRSSWQRRILNPLSEGRDRTRNLMAPSRIRFCCTMRRIPVFCFLNLVLIAYFLSLHFPPSICLEGKYFILRLLVVDLKIYHEELLMWCPGLRIWHCHSRAVYHRCGWDSIPGLETFIYLGHAKKLKKKTQLYLSKTGRGRKKHLKRIKKILS